MLAAWPWPMYPPHLLSCTADVLLVFKLFLSKNQAVLCTCVTLMSHGIPVVLNEEAQAGPSCPGPEILLVPISCQHLLVTATSISMCSEA